MNCTAPLRTRLRMSQPQTHAHSRAITHNHNHDYNRTTGRQLASWQGVLLHVSEGVVRSESKEKTEWHRCIGGLERKERSKQTKRTKQSGMAPNRIESNQTTLAPLSFAGNERRCDVVYTSLSITVLLFITSTSNHDCQVKNRKL